MTKEQIKAVKKEKKKRRAWDKFRDKLLKERDEQTVKFHNNYYWNSFVPSTGLRRKSVGGAAV